MAHLVPVHAVGLQRQQHRAGERAHDGDHRGFARRGVAVDHHRHPLRSRRAAPLPLRPRHVELDHRRRTRRARRVDPVTPTRHRLQRLDALHLARHAVPLRHRRLVLGRLPRQTPPHLLQPPLRLHSHQPKRHVVRRREGHGARHPHPLHARRHRLRARSHHPQPHVLRQRVDLDLATGRHRATARLDHRGLQRRSPRPRHARRRPRHRRHARVVERRLDQRARLAHLRHPRQRRRQIKDEPGVSGIHETHPVVTRRHHRPQPRRGDADEVPGRHAERTLVLARCRRAGFQRHLDPRRHEGLDQRVKPAQGNRRSRQHRLEAVPPSVPRRRRLVRGVEAPRLVCRHGNRRRLATIGTTNANGQRQVGRRLPRLVAGDAADVHPLAGLVEPAIAVEMDVVPHGRGPPGLVDIVEQVGGAPEFEVRQVGGVLGDDEPRAPLATCRSQRQRHDARLVGDGLGHDLVVAGDDGHVDARRGRAAADARDPRQDALAASLGMDGQVGDGDDGPVAGPPRIRRPHADAVDPRLPAQQRLEVERALDDGVRTTLEREGPLGQLARREGRGVAGQKGPKVVAVHAAGADHQPTHVDRLDIQLHRPLGREHAAAQGNAHRGVGLLDGHADRAGRAQRQTTDGDELRGDGEPIGGGRDERAGDHQRRTRQRDAGGHRGHDLDRRHGLLGIKVAGEGDANLDLGVEGSRGHPSVDDLKPLGAGQGDRPANGLAQAQHAPIALESAADRERQVGAHGHAPQEQGSVGPGRDALDGHGRVAADHLHLAAEVIGRDGLVESNLEGGPVGCEGDQLHRLDPQGRSGQTPLESVVGAAAGDIGGLWREGEGELASRRKGARRDELEAVGRGPSPAAAGIGRDGQGRGLRILAHLGLGHHGLVERDDDAVGLVERPLGRHRGHPEPRQSHLEQRGANPRQSRDVDDDKHRGEGGEPPMRLLHLQSLRST